MTRMNSQEQDQYLVSHVIYQWRLELVYWLMGHLTAIDVSAHRIRSHAVVKRFDQPDEAEAENKVGYEYCH